MRSHESKLLKGEYRMSANTNFRPRGSALLSAAISSCLALAANAQQATPAPASSASLDEVVVTGFRASLIDALERKRDSEQQIESITAEDIGKFPDQNIAESLQRLPGIQINRSGGQGTSVLIDGLRQNLVTLNGETFLTGKEFFVTGEGSGGGAGANSQYSSLQSIPSEQVGGVDVIKSPTAANTEGGMGGIIDLKTRAPLAQSMGFNLAGNVRGTDAADSEGGMTPVVSLVAGYKFSEDFGINVGFSYLDEDTHTKQYQAQNRAAWRITNSAQNGNYVGSPVVGTLSTIGQRYIVPQYGYFSDIEDTRQTIGATLGAEWRWSDGIKSTFNWFYTQEEGENTTYSSKTWFNGQGANPGSLFPAIDPSKPYSIDGNGVVQSASFMANGAENATLFQGTSSEANNFQLLTTFDNGGNVSGAVNVSYSAASSDYQAAAADTEQGAYGAFGGTGFIRPTAPGCNNGGSSCVGGNHGYTFDWNNGGTSGLPSISYPNAYGVSNVLSNTAYTLFKSNWAWANMTDQDTFAIKGDLKYSPAFAEGLVLHTGLRLAGRDVDQTFGRYLINGANPYGIGGVGAGTAAGNCCIAAGQSGTWLYYSDPGYATIPYSTGVSAPGQVRIYNNFAAGPIAVKDAAAGGLTNPATFLNSVWTQAGVPNNTQRFFKDNISSFQIEEQTTALYFIASVGKPSDAYHIDAGVRVVATDLEVNNAQTAAVQTWYGTASWNGVNANDVPVSNSRDYIDVLPSLNFRLDLSDTQKIRMGAARVMSPQNLFQLGTGNSYNFTRGTDGPGGQARYFFATGSSGNPDLDPYRASQFNVSYENYIAEGAVVSAAFFYKDVDNFVEVQAIPTLVMDDFGGTTGNVNQPVNAGDGEIYGVELGGQYAFDSGFGFSANYTWSQSKSNQETAFDDELPIPGVSENSFNVTAFYERAGFSARLAYSWRSEAVNDSLVGATFSFPDQTGTQKVYGVYSADYGQLDAQVSYDFSEHFGVFASGNNLTNEALHTYLQYPNQPFTYEESGTRFFVGVKGKL
jgi:iron complex outermembrane recepter protein